MTLKALTIPHLASGVSQQPAPNRLRTSSEAITNAVLSVVSGVQKRPPLKHLAVLSTGIAPDTNSAIWTVRRDAQNKFALVVVDGDLELYNVSTGAKQNITFNASKDYLNSSDPKSDIRVASIGDQIFILNRSITCQATSPVDSRPNPALRASVFIKRSVANTTYAIFVNNVLAGQMTTSTNTSASTSLEGTSKIAEDIAADIIAVGNHTNVIQKGPVISFDIAEGDKLATTDQFGGQAMRFFTDRVQAFDELPPEEDEGRLVRINAPLEGEGEDFHVFYSNGVWEETVGYNQKREMDAATLPHRLKKTGADTWEFDVESWGERTCGDDKTNADPTFVGRTINDIMFHKGRMLLLTDENVVMSEANNQLGFYRSTVTQLLDSDRIDIAANTAEVHTLYHLASFENRLLAFSDTALFEIKSPDELLSPKTVEMSKTSTYENSSTVRPAQAGPSVFFVHDSGPSSRVYEVLVDAEISSTTVDELTEHVPDYIKTDLVSASASPSESCMVILSANERSSLAVHKWFVEGRRKIQSSWSKWTFEGQEILGASFIEGDLFVISRIGSDIHLSKMVVDDRPFSEENRQILLDNKTPSSAATVTFNSGTGKTEVTVPWAFSGELEFWTEENPFGEQLIADKVTDTEYHLAGDQSGRAFVFGIPYEWRVDLSTQFIRERRGDGEVTVQDGRFQLGKISVQYQGTSYFNLVVGLENREERVLTFSGRVLSDADNKFGETPLHEGSFSGIIGGVNTGTKLSLTSSKPLPVSIGSIEIQGRHYPKARFRS